MQIRRVVSFVDDVLSEAGKSIEPPLRKVAVCAICENPCAGRYVEDLSILIEGSVGVGKHIAGIAAALIRPWPILSYGKGAIVGIAGEPEHAEAVLTTPYGNTMRAAAGGGNAWICHMAKRASPGESIDIPLAHKDALTVRSHYDAMTVTLHDAPLPDEIAIVCCFASRGRPHHRIGGHGIEDLVGDGLR